MGKRFTIYTTGEVFFHFVQSYQYFSRWRYSFGLNYEISKNITANIRYILQDDVGVAEPVMEHILVVGMAVDLPKFKKKKKKKTDEEDN